MQCFCAKKTSEKSKWSLCSSGSGSQPCVMTGSGSRPNSSYLPSNSLQWEINEHCESTCNAFVPKRRVKSWNDRYVRRDQDPDLAWWRDPDPDPIVRIYLEFSVQFTSMRNKWALWVDMQCFCAKKTSEKLKWSLCSPGSGSRHYVKKGSGSRPNSSYLPGIFRPIHFYEK